MKAIIIDREYSNLSEMLQNLRVGEREIPPLKDRELLIKITGAPCNPSDIAFLRGLYNIKKPFPAVPGFEGGGIIAYVGKGLHSADWIGKKVSCFTQEQGDGTWAEYLLTSPENCIVLDDNFPDEQAPVFFINPFTAYGLIDNVIKKRAKVIVQNAAAGQVGRFIRLLADEHGIEVINIVRRPQHVDLLKKEGAKYVLNIRDKNFISDFRNLVSELHPGMVLDAVAGEQTAHFLEVMPKYSEIIIYGGLSGTPINLDILGLIFKSYRITGFNLGDWISQTPKVRFQEIADELQKKVIQGILRTKIQKTITFNEIYNGLYQYITRMSEGKVIIKPQ